MDCPAGTKPNSDASDCENCPSGQTSLEGSSYCTLASLVGLVPNSKPNVGMNSAAKSTKTALASTGIAAKAVCAGSSVAFGFGVMARLVQNARYFTIAYSDEAVSAFSNEDDDTGLDPPDSFSEDNDSKELAFSFQRYETEPNFFINYWGNMIPIVILFSCVVVLKLLKMYLVDYKRQSWAKKGITSLQASAGNYLITNLYGGFDDILLFFILDSQTSTFASSFSWASFFCGLLFLVIGFAFFIFHYNVLKKYQAAKKQGEENDQESKKEAEEENKVLENWKQENSQVKVLFDDFRDENLPQQSFLALFMIRSCILNLFLCLLVNHPLVEACLYLAVNIAFSVYLIKKNPFDGLMNAIAQYFCEVIVIMSYTGVLILACLDHRRIKAEETRLTIERVIVILSIILNIGGLVFQCLDIGGKVLELHKSYKEWKKKRQQKLKVATTASVLGSIEISPLVKDKRSPGVADASIRSPHQMFNFSASTSNNLFFPSTNTKLVVGQEEADPLGMSYSPTKKLDRSVWKRGFHMDSESNTLNVLDTKSPTGMLSISPSETMVAENNNNNKLNMLMSPHNESGMIGLTSNFGLSSPSSPVNGNGVKITSHHIGGKEENDNMEEVLSPAQRRIQKLNHKRPTFTQNI